MKSKNLKTSTAEFENAAAMTDRIKWVLRLYVNGMTLKSTQAIVKARHLCEKYLAGRFELKVIDICQLPALAKREQIIATPTLIKELPLPLRKIMGDLSDMERLLVDIDLESMEF